MKATGKLSAVGFLHQQGRWTETFTNNGCGFNVRAVVSCLDSQADDVAETHHGKTIYGDGYSYYTCDITQLNLEGYPEYFNGVKWVGFENSN